MEDNLTISIKFYHAQSLGFSKFTFRNLYQRYSKHVLKDVGIKVFIAELFVNEKKKKKEI